MPDYQLNITSFLDKSVSLPVIDVRSPAEFERGHMPGACNMPLFSNEERSIVGTLYLQKGSSEAMLKGLELIGPKLKEFAAAALNISSGREVLLHCWRGGMRSNSMAWLLNTAGIKSHTLDGGYKSYRRYVQSFFSRSLNLVVIGGMTGSGKTGVIEALESMGKQVIHLERLANHRGSVFGGIGLPAQPTTEQFENDLFHVLRHFNTTDPVYVEDESLAIGQVFIPKSLYEQFSNARTIKLIVPLKHRIRQLVSAYAGGDREMLVSGVRRIEKRLGTENAAQAIGYIQNGNMEEAVEVILRYYDKIYDRSMALHKSREVLEINIKEETPAEIASSIVHRIQQSQQPQQPQQPQHSQIP
jgi:tRNA 2-selenouridine synthase